MTDQSADNTGTQNTDAGTQQTDATANVQDTSQQQPTDGGNADGKATQNTQDAAKAVPDKYDFKLPDGIALDPELTEEFSGMAKELKLGQDEAQKFADLGVKLTQKISAKQAEVVEAAKKEWRDSSRTDKEFGGDKLEANLAVANNTFKTFGTPALRELLDQTGLGEHPELIRWAYKVGQAISEDKFVGGDTAQKVEKNPANVMFPSMKSA